MPVRMRSADEPLPDRKAQHAREIAELRLKMAAIVKIVFTVLAVLLALGALLVAAGERISPDNSLVKLVWNLCDVFDGPFSKDNGVFVFDGDNAEKLDAVVNWGAGAVAYMLVGNLLAKVLRPRGRVLGRS